MLGFFIMSCLQLSYISSCIVLTIRLKSFLRSQVQTRKMNAATAIGSIKTIQTALQVITALQLTAYMWPQQAIVKDGAKFDYIIVGAGTAGSVVANRLTEDPNTNVLLIEAGGDPPLESDLPGIALLLKRSRYDWNYTAESEKYSKQCHQKPYHEMTTGKMLGGTSSLNYMLYWRGLPQDYDSWADVTKDDTWKWDNVLPYFTKSEKMEDPEILNCTAKKFHGIGGYMTLTKDDRADLSKYFDSYKELGNEIVSDNTPTSPLGYSRLVTTIADGSRQSAAYSFLRPIKERGNFYVLKNTLVTKILFDENKTAVGVQAMKDDGSMISIKAEREVIISAGAINSPKLLMLSGIGPRDHLRKLNIDEISNLPVGKNLNDQIGVGLIHNLEKLQDPSPSNPHEFPAEPVPIGGFVALDKSKTYPDYQSMSFRTGSLNMLFFCSFIFRFNHDICDSVFRAGHGRMQVFNQIIKFNPRSRGEVKLRSSNPIDPPSVRMGYFTDEADLEDLASYVEHFSHIVNTTYYRSIDAEEVVTLPTCAGMPRGSSEYWKCYTSCMMTGTSHFSSTCAMGSVVDSRLRVYGVQRLRVADASIMPSIVSGNPAAPVMMIGEKAADFIKQDNPSP